jgi:hypothetical protein
VLAGCSPTASTIGGHDEAELGVLADRAAATCQARRARVPPRPFTTDGCTLTPDGTWQRCCVEHDMVYWCGGRADERRDADETLRSCLASATDRARATIYYHGVRAAAAPWLPVPWRWAYGWPWPSTGE